VDPLDPLDQPRIGKARSDAGRCCQAWKPERETPSIRHMSEIEWFAFSAAMKR
jgi:hypothetical protein